jgi:8-oxo-dGTP pyrophosphatase MutT (NUDIX family)
MYGDSCEFEFKISRRNNETASATGTIGESNCALGEAHVIVHSAVMSPEKSGLRTVRPRVRIATFFPPPKNSKRRECEQVAAVCYRIGRSGIEFLLIQTRGGRWTFPKGGIEPGLTHAQAAALEAFEEAGVHGRIEESSFTHYTRRKRGGIRGSVRSPKKEFAVNAHLCEVLRLGSPQESNRNPTWFSAQRAKRRLQEDRKPKVGAELAQVVELAMARIQQMHQPKPEWTQEDALQKVQFENIHLTADPATRASFVKYIQARPGLRTSAAINLAVRAYLRRVLSLDRAPDFNQDLVQGLIKNVKRSGRRADIAAVRSPVQVIEIDNYPVNQTQSLASRNGGKKPRP